MMVKVRERQTSLVLSLVALCLSACVERLPVCGEDADEMPYISEWVKVDKVVDGDTVKLVDGRTVRYLGIDTPEMTGAEPAQPFAEEASLANAELAGSEIGLEFDGATEDAFGRTFAHPWVEGPAGLSLVSERLVRLGLARVYYTAGATVHEDVLRIAEEAAQAEHLGIWSTYSPKCVSELDGFVYAPAPGELLITELMTDPLGPNDDDREWLELYNVTERDLCLAELFLHASGPGGPPVHLFPVAAAGPLSLGPRQFVEVGNLLEVPFVNIGGTVAIWNADVVIDSVSYGDADEAGLPQPPEGASLALCGECLDPVCSKDPGSWHPAQGKAYDLDGNIGTPGHPNKECSGRAAVSCDPACPAPFLCVEHDGQPVCARVPGPDDLSLSEYLSNGSEKCSQSKDWFEVVNLTKDYLTLSGCTVRDAIAHSEGISSASCLVPPDGYLALLNAMDGAFAFGSPSFCFIGNVPNFNKAEDIIALTCGEVELFSIEYGAAGPFPVPQDVNGQRASVQLHPDYMGGDEPNPDHWTISCKAMECGDLATPGAENTECP